MCLVCRPGCRASVPPERLTIPHVNEGDHTGCSAAIFHDFAVLGACSASRHGHHGAGIVHTLRVSSRQHTGVVASPVPTTHAAFGTALAMGEYRGSGILLVGAPGEGAGFYSNVGFVYVFSFGLNQNASSFDHSFVIKLYAEGARANDNFGAALAINGDRVVVGAPGPPYYPAGYATIDHGGSAYVFDLGTGEQLAMLQPRDANFAPQIGCFGFGSSVAIASGVVVVGAPRAKRPCAWSTKSGAAFVYVMSQDGRGMRARDARWWWGDGPTYNQSAYLLPPEADTTAGQVEFGYSLAIAHTVWLNNPSDVAIAIGAPAASAENGAVYLVGPFDPSSQSHDGLPAHLPIRRTSPVGASVPTQRVLGPAYLQFGARFGHSLAIDRPTGLALVGAPGGYTVHGHSGAALRSWLLRDAFADPDNHEFNSTSAEYLALQHVQERLVWGADANPGDAFGSSVALGPLGHSLCGCSNLSGWVYDAAGGTRLYSSGAAYMYLPVLESPSAPPSPPPPPWTPIPPASPSPPSAPPFPPFPPPDITPILVSSTSAAVVALLLFVTIMGFRLLRCVAPQTYKRITKSCRKPVKKLSADSGRGTIGDQLRAILAEYAASTNVWAEWDVDKGGSVSRKEFRVWWPRIGYDAPAEDLNALFDEFDEDGSGEIDEDEFRTAFEERGKLWLELKQLADQADANESLQLKVNELEAKLLKKQKQLAIDKSALESVEQAQTECQEALTKFDEEIADLTVELLEHQARLVAFKGGVKEIMRQNTVVNAFKSALTPDEAAGAIQARVRGRTARREVQAKLEEKKMVQVTSLDAPEVH